MGLSCAVEGGCPSDYIAVSLAALSIILLLTRLALPYLIHNVPRTKGSAFWLLWLQLLASFNLLASLVMAANVLKLKKRYWWQSCYIWAAWFEGPLGFGLLMSCRFVQAFKLYYLFVKRRLSPMRTHVLLPLILFPWIGAATSWKYVMDSNLLSNWIQYAIKLNALTTLIFGTIALLQLNCLYFSIHVRPLGTILILDEPISFIAVVLHIKKPLNLCCHMPVRWIIPVVSLHILYVAAMVGITRAVRHIEFRFHEFKDLLQGILVSTVVIGVWVTSYVMNEVHEDIAWLQVSSRFLLLATASVLVLSFYSISMSQPLISQMSLRKRDPWEIGTMGRALGIPDSGILSQGGARMDINPNEPLDKLLLNKRFRQSFMTFADSCLAGESVHFYDEVHELGKIPTNDPIRRIYMARHIIEEYIISGAVTEVNISHRTRQEILNTQDLAHPSLFTNAVTELMQLMKTNLVKDYWSSMFFMKLKEESIKPSRDNEFMERLVGWDFSPRLSSVHGADDPFNQEHPLKSSGDRSGFHDNDSC